MKKSFNRSIQSKGCINAIYDSKSIKFQKFNGIFEMSGIHSNEKIVPSHFIGPFKLHARIFDDRHKFYKNEMLHKTDYAGLGPEYDSITTMASTSPRKKCSA